MFNQETTKGHNKIGNKSNNGATTGAQAKTGVTRELSLEIARHWPEWATLRIDVSLLNGVRAACQSLLGTFKVTLHETIRNDDFQRKTALKHCCDIVSNSRTTLFQHCNAVLH